MSESKGKSAVTVRIGGEDHVIRANVEPEYTVRCAKWVDDRITEIRRQLGLIESHKAAILAALSITDELFQLQAKLSAEKAGSAKSLERLALRLETALAEEPPPPPSPPVQGDGAARPGPAPREGIPLPGEEKPTVSGGNPTSGDVDPGSGQSPAEGPGEAQGRLL